MVYRMIEGACRNTISAHPNAILNAQLARSIAKRAAGTLTSGWRRVLAAPLVWSEGDSAQTGSERVASGIGRRVPNPVRRRANGHGVGGVSHSERHTLLRLHEDIGHMAGAAKRSGQTERGQALIDVLRMIAKITHAP